MNESKMSLENLLKICEGRGIKHIDCAGIHIEFFPPNPKDPEPMALDPVALSKILSASMPADDKMLFAATEDPDPEPNPVVSMGLEIPE